MRIQKREGAPAASEYINTVDDSARVLEKLKTMREQIGKDHLRIMNKDRGEVLAKTKIELLEVYAAQMAGQIKIDNK